MHERDVFQSDASAISKKHRATRAMGQRVLRLVFQFAIMAALLLLLARLVDFKSLSAAYARATLQYLPLAAIILTAAIASRIVRLWILTAGRAAFLPVFHANNVGMAVNNLLPLRAGEVITALLLGKIGGIGAPAALSIIAIDRILDIIVLLILYAALALLTPELLGSMRYADVILVTFVLAVAASMWFACAYRRIVRGWVASLLTSLSFARRERWLRRIDGILDGLAVLGDRRTMIAAAAWSPVGWILSIMACQIVLSGFWPDAPLKAAVLAVCLSALSVSIVTVPAGVGVMHASLFFSVTLFGLDAENALLFAITYHALLLVLSTALGLVGLKPAGLTIEQLAARLRRESA
jgi:uncharacterized protein (TIRG00374 family)